MKRVLLHISFFIEVQEKGYRGSETLVKDFVIRLRRGLSGMKHPPPSRKTRRERWLYLSLSRRVDCGSADIEQGMLKGQPPNDGHRKNLLSPAFHQVGIGIVIDAKGLVWVTEDFTN